MIKRKDAATNAIATVGEEVYMMFEAGNVTGSWMAITSTAYQQYLIFQSHYDHQYDRILLAHEPMVLVLNQQYKSPPAVMFSSY